MARILVSIFAPSNGGVLRMTQFALSCLRRAGHELVPAWYEHYSRSPELSVPVWALPLRRPSVRRERSLHSGESTAIGAWLPELEFTHYLPTRHWRELLAGCDAHVAVSGNCLAATPFALSRTPFVAWVATAWGEDRKDRVRRLPPYRRLFDRLLVRPAAERLERRILRAGRIFTVSGHTARSLGRIGGIPALPVIRFPVDCGANTPRPEAVVRGRVGFAGRLEDPRKNVDLLLDAIALARRGGVAVTGLLMGAREPQFWRERIAAHGLEASVEVVPFREQSADLIDLMRTLDIFVIPSHQEGLCIAALEAMACGCPVVSTRCGGPEDFVVDGATGLWSDATADAMAGCIVRVTRDRTLRERLSAAARALVVREYGEDPAGRALLAAVRETFPGLSG